MSKTFKFGKTSLSRIETCKPDLENLFKRVVSTYDCSILCGTRTRQEQDLAYNTKRSKVKWPNSKHNSNPSSAVDVAPYPIDWGEKGTAEQRRKAIARFYHFAGYVKAMADVMNIKIRWGGDWDGDNNFADQRFDDLVHWELRDD
jgi:hypothetical protein